MNIMKSVKALCPPAQLYLVVSVCVMIILVIQNCLNSNKKKLCLGPFTCNVTNVVIVLIIKLLSIVFWTIVLDALCKYGLTKLSWILVLLPYILLMFLFILN